MTYLTLRQWPRGERFDIDPRIRVVIAGPRMALYTGPVAGASCQPLVFGAGVLWHLLRHGAATTSCTPVPSPISRCWPPRWRAPLARYSLVVDWFEVWSRQYWRGYLAVSAGASASSCNGSARGSRSALSFLTLHTQSACASRALRGQVTVLRGLYAGYQRARWPPSARGASPFATHPTPPLAPSAWGSEPSVLDLTDSTGHTGPPKPPPPSTCLRTRRRGAARLCCSPDA